MTNYQEIFEALPENLKEAVLSVKTADAVHNATRAEGLNDQETSAVAELLGDVLMNVIGRGEFLPAMVKAGIKNEAALKIFNTLLKEIIEPALGPGAIVYKDIPLPPISEEKSVAIDAEKVAAVKIEPPVAQTPLKPGFIEPATTSESPRAEAAAPGEIIHPAPFVLHEEKSIEEAENFHKDFSLQRPAFYKPVFNPGETNFGTYIKPRAAKVELGGGEIIKNLSAPLKTLPQQARVVHYSEFKTEVDPFGAQPKTTLTPNTGTYPAQTPPTPILPIRSNNVVDLKDLPLK